MKTLLTFIAATMFGQAPQPPKQPPAPMTFFVTSTGAGNGANLGGVPVRLEMEKAFHH